MAQMQRHMLPIGQLMIEHRLTFRMVHLFNTELDRIGKTGQADPDFIDTATGYMREFADSCHHGKEERILFTRLAEKPLAPELKKTMEDLIQEHVLMRKITNDLVRAKEKYLKNDPGGKAEIISGLNDIVQLYPAHMEKEDKHFFSPPWAIYRTRKRITCWTRSSSSTAGCFTTGTGLLWPGWKSAGT